MSNADTLLTVFNSRFLSQGFGSNGEFRHLGRKKAILGADIQQSDNKDIYTFYELSKKCSFKQWLCEAAGKRRIKKKNQFLLLVDALTRDSASMALSEA